MAYLPTGLPRPRPTPDDAPFWAACRERRLVFQRCAACGRFRHPPVPVCPACRSPAVTWTEAFGPARLYTFTEVHHAAHAAVRERLPYVVAVVEFPAMDGVRLVSNLVDGTPPRIGAALELVWEDAGEGLFLPRFRSA